MFFGIIATRYRDVAPLLEAGTQLLFYVTPIVWMTQTLKDQGGTISDTDAAREWLRTTGFENIDELNKVLKETAVSWVDKVNLPFEDRQWLVRDF